MFISTCLTNRRNVQLPGSLISGEINYETFLQCFCMSSSGNMTVVYTEKFKWSASCLCVSSPLHFKKSTWSHSKLLLTVVMPDFGYKNFNSNGPQTHKAHRWWNSVIRFSAVTSPQWWSGLREKQWLQPGFRHLITVWLNGYCVLTSWDAPQSKYLTPQ